MTNAHSVATELVFDKQRLFIVISLLDEAGSPIASANFGSEDAVGFIEALSRTINKCIELESAKGQGVN